MNEGYLPLYRKYRPQKLDDIVGQAHIKRALTNAIELNKISHAYLFTGPRGTGKTSTARILAKSLNCVNGPTVTPCEECESCKSITATIPVDVIEMDAASNRSVEDAREILEKVNYAPIHGKYKIYIIDEVHMLSKEAFNTLLKTLEEPPKNVIFILATTESYKVLDTIKSRCQRFDFKRITTNDIVEHLKKIAKLENIKISADAISVIAKSSAGGMRDSLALLDQVSTMGMSEEITVEDINNLLGRLSFETLLQLGTHIANSDGNSAINTLEKIYNDGNEPMQILSNLLLFFKNVLIYKTCDEESSLSLTGLTQEQLRMLDNLKNALEKHQLIFLVNKISDYLKEIKLSNNPQLWLEVALIDLSNLSDNTKLLDLQERLLRLESGEEYHPIRQNIVKPVIEKKTLVDTKLDAKFETDTKQNVQVVQNAEQKVENVNEPKLDEAHEKTEVIHQSAEKKSSIFGNINDLEGLWIQILNEIPMSDGGGFAKMKALTQLVKCDESGVVVAVKKPLSAAAFNLPEKKKIMMSAICKVLGTDSVDLLIRERLPEDAQIKKKYNQQPKASPIAPPKDLIDNDDVIDEKEIEDSVKSVEKKSNQDLNMSDQQKMIIDLFDAKIL